MISGLKSGTDAVNSREANARWISTRFVGYVTGVGILISQRDIRPAYSSTFPLVVRKF